MKFTQKDQVRRWSAAEMRHLCGGIRRKLKLLLKNFAIGIDRLVEITIGQKNAVKIVEVSIDKTLTDQNN